MAIRVVLRTVLVFCIAVSCAALFADDFKPIPPDAGIDQVLQALQTRGDQLGDCSADITLTNTDQTTGTSDAEIGKLLLQNRPNADGRVRVTFTQRTEDTKIFDENRQFTLVGGILDDRNFLKKQEDRMQVAKPGEKFNLFKLGHGPFPLPIGQKPQDVKDQFDVTLAPGDKDDPANSVHLTLKPKPQTDLARKYSQIEVWTDRQSGMPVRIVTSDSDGQHIQTAELKNLKLDAHFTDEDFALPDLQGWDVVEQPYRQ